MKLSRVLALVALAFMLLAIPASSFAGVVIQVGIAPPVLPVYVQPACPGDGYIWTPGYWAYGPDGYYWVPGTWVMAPQPGLLWTPGYWGWSGGFYLWHGGYWGPHIGFYGGVNYGFGYFGHGYEGGYWRGGAFFYNRSVNNINVTNVHIYNKTVINNTYVNRVSYNGGRRGINVRPQPFEESAAREHHFEPTGMQMQHEHAAAGNRDFLASVNHGRPAVAATERPAEFNRGVVAARPVGGMNRNVPRPGNSDRGMQRNDSMAQNRGGQPHNSAPQMRDHGNGTPRPNAPRQETARPHENVQRGEGHPNNGHQDKPRR